MRLSLPDAVLMHRLQGGLFGVTGGFLIQVLKAFSGCHAFLRTLFGHVKFPSKRKTSFIGIIDKQHRITVVTLRKIWESGGVMVYWWFTIMSKQNLKILTAATRLFSVMKVTHRRGKVSEVRLAHLPTKGYNHLISRIFFCKVQAQGSR